MTGGRAASFRWEILGYFKAEQRTLLDKVMQDMSGSYNLELKLRQPVSSLHRWRLSVSDNHPERKRFSVLYPPKLAPCK